jgi:hypothetical protein
VQDDGFNGSEVENSEPLSVAAPEPVALRWVGLVAVLGLIGTVILVWWFVRSRRNLSH